MNGDKLYVWRAWSAGRAEILDAGWIVGRTREEARANASFAIGGRRRAEIREVEVVLILHPINGER